MPRRISTFLIGPPRCATTSIIDVFRAHPELSVSTPKELKFFSIHYDTSLDYAMLDDSYDDVDLTRVYCNPIDCNMMYVRDRIHLYNPCADIIMGVRHPIERAISHWGIHRYKLPIGRVKNIWDEFDHNAKTFSLNKFKSEGDFIPYCNQYGSCTVPQYLECSMYNNIYEMYKARFEDVMVYDTFRLVRDWPLTIDDVLDFIGVCPTQVASAPESNSIGSWGGHIPMAEYVREFKNRYPEIVYLYRTEAIALDRALGTNYYEEWAL